MIYARVETPDGEQDYGFLNRNLYREAKQLCKMQGVKMREIRANEALIVMDVARDFRLPTKKEVNN